MTDHSRTSTYGADHIGPVEAAEILGVTPRTIVRWADDGTLPVAFRTVKGHRRFAAVDVEVLRKATEGTPAP